MQTHRFRRAVARILLLFLTAILIAPAPSRAQEVNKCLVFDKIVRVAPLNEYAVVFEGSDEAFTMTYKPETEAGKDPFPNSKWTVNVRAGTAVFDQPTPPGKIEVKFTPPFEKWCMGEELRFAISGTSTPTVITSDLRYAYTPRFNVASWAVPTGTNGFDPFVGTTLNGQPFAGEGTLRLQAPPADPVVQFLVESAFGGLIVDYRYKVTDAAGPTGDVLPNLQFAGCNVWLLLVALLVYAFGGSR
jgi:hypothetical protein